MMHNWVLMYTGPNWSDWTCSRCKQQVLAGRNANPNKDAEIWQIQGKKNCEDEIVHSVQTS